MLAMAVDKSITMIPSGRLEILLAPSQRAADTAQGPEDPRLVTIGELVANDRCIGRLSFIVPDVPAGNYVLVAHCAECRPGMVFFDTCDPKPELAEQADGRGTVFTVGQFTVASGAALSRTGSPLLPAIGSALLLLALGAGLLLRVRRRPPQP